MCCESVLLKKYAQRPVPLAFPFRSRFPFRSHRPRPCNPIPAAPLSDPATSRRPPLRSGPATPLPHPRVFPPPLASPVSPPSRVDAADTRPPPPLRRRRLLLQEPPLAAPLVSGASGPPPPPPRVALPPRGQADPRRALGAGVPPAHPLLGKHLLFHLDSLRAPPLRYAVAVLSRILPNPDPFSLNTILRIAASSPRSRLALALHRRGLAPPDTHTYPPLLHVCAPPRAPRRGAPPRRSRQERARCARLRQEFARPPRRRVRPVRERAQGVRRNTRARAQSRLLELDAQRVRGQWPPKRGAHRLPGDVGCRLQAGWIHYVLVGKGARARSGYRGVGAELGDEEPERAGSRCNSIWYILKVTIGRNYVGNIVEYRDFCVRNYTLVPTINNSIKMEVGIEDCLHIEFEYSKSIIKIQNMDLEIRRRESTGSGSNTYVETETLAKFELMDGAPVRG
ncbi:protein transport protein SEC31-like [Phragmites australis]|uniref:protein transport protein SEC31-like n=1 Tax=Phragmites australis TaxID=29695 RepID=UPI002D76C0B2|nr:protein transport protein SEC31-like [Phragmites australis]